MVLWSRLSFLILLLFCLTFACGIDTSGLGYDLGDTNLVDTEDAPSDTLASLDAADSADSMGDVLPDACEPICQGDQIIECQGPPTECDVTCDESGSTPVCMTLDAPNLGAVSFLQKPPRADRLILTSLNTSDDCNDTHDAFYDVRGQGRGFPEICVLAATEVVVSGEVTISGARALAIVGRSIVVERDAVIRLDANGRTPGPGGYVPADGPQRGGTDSDGGGGGGMGGAGGRGGGGNNDRGNPGGAVASLTRLIGGSGGGTGNNNNDWGQGRARGGAGGGALQLVAFDSVSVAGTINIGGGGGAATDRDGGGGGAGGTLVIVSARDVVFLGALIGGGGGGGCRGQEGGEASDTTMRASGGSNCGGQGGVSTSDSQTAAGTNGLNRGTPGLEWGGGGGGGAGLLWVIAQNRRDFTSPYQEGSSAVTLGSSAPTIVPLPSLNPVDPVE